MVYNDYENLKYDFIRGGISTLKEFAEASGVNYKTLVKNTDGWLEARAKYQQSKRAKISQGIQNCEVHREIDRARRVLSLWDSMTDKVEAIFKLYDESAMSKKDVYSLEKLAGVIERIQRGQTMYSTDNMDENLDKIIATIKGEVDG